MLSKAKTLLEESYNKATGYKRFTAQIKEELRSLQLKALNPDEAREYEKRKDMWAELHIRLYKEAYLVNRLVVPRLSKYVNIILQQGEPPILHYDIEDRSEMTALYNKIITDTNNRVIALKDYAEYIKNNTENKELKKDMEDAILLFKKKVVECVVQNCTNQMKYIQDTGQKTEQVVHVLQETMRNVYV